MGGEDIQARLRDVELYDLAKEDGGESFPAELVDHLLAGHNPVKVYRSHRNLTQAQLAGATGIDVDYLSQIETGKVTGSTKVLTALAQALDIDVDDLT